MLVLHRAVSRPGPARPSTKEAEPGPGGKRRAREPTLLQLALGLGAFIAVVAGALYLAAALGG